MFQHVVFWLDSQISVKSTFWSDVSWLVFLPIIPFLVVAYIFYENPNVRIGSGLLGFVFCIPWAVLVFKRRAKKIAEWQEPNRFSEENGGY